MTTPPDTARQALTKPELLSAIDSEISERETLASRHGINAWGLAAAIVAVLWLAITETLDRQHSWLNTFLMFITASWCMNLLLYPLTKRLVPAITPSLSPSRPQTPHRVFSEGGLPRPAILYAMAETILCMCLALYFSAQGFHLLGGILLGINAGSFLILAATLGLCHFRLPLVPKETARPKRFPWLLLTLGIIALMLSPIVPTLVMLQQVAQQLSKPDAQLGCTLAALGVLLRLWFTLNWPPASLAQLRSLRTKLAFGWLDLPQATREAEHIILGPPPEHYVTIKADALTALLNERISLFEKVGSIIDRIHALALLLTTTPQSDDVIRQAKAEYADLMRKLLSSVKDGDSLVQRAKKLRSQLGDRVWVAKVALPIPAEVLAATIKNVDQLARKSDQMAAQLLDRLKSLEPDRHAVSALTKDHKLPTPSGFTVRRALAVLIRE